MPILAPRETRDALNVANGQIVDVENFAMLFLRFMPEQYIETVQKGNNIQHKMDSYYNARFLKELVETWNSTLCQRPSLSPAITAFAERHEQAVRVYAASHGYECRMLRLRLRKRMIVGKGASNVFESGMTLHHLLGTPFIPGSAVKGVVRHWLRQGMDWSTRFPRSVNMPDYAGQAFEDWTSLSEMLFGTQEAEGLIECFDALPLAPPHFLATGQTPHYGPYYSESADKAVSPPSDWYDPVPFSFLAVRPGASFTLPIVMRSLSSSHDEQDNHVKVLLDAEHDTVFAAALEWITRALQDWGIGAKTRRGYGKFNVK
jgi:CRISPR-associated protein Cmr6